MKYLFRFKNRSLISQLRTIDHHDLGLLLRRLAAEWLSLVARYATKGCRFVLINCCGEERVAEAVSKSEMQPKLQKIYLKTGSPIESHAAAVLTPYAFNKLQKELMLAPQFASFQTDEYCFQVRHHTQKNGGCSVIWVPCQEHISCTCSQFEFSGILCRHVLHVLSTNNCFHIPGQYLPARWRIVNLTSNSRDHSERIHLLETLTSTLVTESIETEERFIIACDQIATVLSRVKDLLRHTHESAYSCPSDSIILSEVEASDDIVQAFSVGNPHDMGKLKERRPRDEVDVSRKRRHCSGPCYGQFGRDLSDCTLIGTDQLNGSALGYI